MARSEARPVVATYPDETNGLLSDVRALHGIIDAVPHPIFVKDASSRFVIVNKALCKMMGRTFDELVGHDDYDFFPREQADVFRAMDRQVFETGENTENEKSTSPMEKDRCARLSRARVALCSRTGPRC